MKNSLKQVKSGLLLEAEVAPKAQTRFENRYFKATGHSISPGSSPHYQSQSNKWGAELRVYFNDPGMASLLRGLGLNVESRSKGYMSDQYRYRFNDNAHWWKIVEKSSQRLGPN